MMFIDLFSYYSFEILVAIVSLHYIFLGMEVVVMYLFASWFSGSYVLTVRSCLL